MVEVFMYFDRKDLKIRVNEWRNIILNELSNIEEIESEDESEDENENTESDIVEKEENLVEEDENPPNEPEPTAPKPTTTNTGSSLVIPEDAKSSSNVENSRNSMKVSATENTNHRLR